MLYLTIFLALLTPNSVVRALLVASTVWMHETATLNCLPLYFVVEWLYFGRRKTALTALALGLASCVIINIFFQTADDSTMEAYKTNILHRANWRIDHGYLRVFSDWSAEKTFRLDTWFHGVYKSYAVYCVLLASILAQGFVAPQKKWLATMFPAILIFLAAVSPLAISFFAFDGDRWIFSAMTNTSVLFVLFHTRMAAPWRRVFVVAAFFFFFVSYVPLLGRGYRHFNEIIPFLKNFGQFVSSIPR